jgi:F-type H+-transporting ATPase subunit b
MDTTLQQAGQLLLDAIPTVVLLLLLYAIYQNLVRKPLNKALQERNDRTEGAVQKARAAVAAADARTQEYEQKLRDARLAIYKAQESRRQQAQQLRAQAVAEARTRAQEQIRQARQGIEQDMAAARTGLQGEIEQLANEIIRTILKPAGSSPMTGGAQ